MAELRSISCRYCGEGIHLRNISQMDVWFSNGGSSECPSGPLGWHAPDTVEDTQS